MSRLPRFGSFHTCSFAVYSVLWCFSAAAFTQPRDASNEEHVCAPSALPEGATSMARRGGVALRTWEPVPSVIRADGIDAFRLEVGVEAPMTSVTLGDVSAFLIPPQTPPVALRDDGLGEDRQAGDLVYTSDLFRYDTTVALPEFFARDPDSPAGLFQTTIGTVQMADATGTTTEFLLAPSVGLMSPAVPQTRYVRLNETLQVTSHLINVRVDERHVQRVLRLIDDAMAPLTQRIYGQVPDSIDFFTFFSIDKVERTSSDARENFFVGRHLRVQTEFTGSELPAMDASAAYGSAGVLLGINLLDAFSRGTTTANATHELLHHWVAYLADSLLSQDGHYRAQSSAASLVGGFRWVANNDGTFTRDCDIGRNGAFHVPPVDLYFMGLATADQVGTVWLSDPADPLACGDVIADPIVSVPIDSIVSLYGERLPPPGEAPRNFRVAFVVSSHDRLLNPTELAFYHILARHYTSTVPAAAPAPYVGDNWVSVQRFFGDFSTWRTNVPMLLDGDADGDVDSVEYRMLENCLSGPGTTTFVSCTRWDRNSDEHVDLLDVAGFMQIFTGPDWR